MQFKTKTAIIYFLVIISINLFDCIDEKNDENQAGSVNTSNISTIDITNDDTNANNNNQTTTEVGSNKNQNDEDGDAMEICNRTFSIPKGISIAKLHYH